MKLDELAVIPTSALDVPLPTQLRVNSEIATVEAVLAICDEQKDLAPAFNYGRRTFETVHAKGIGLARLLWGVHERWAEYGPKDETFEDRVYAEWGIAKETTTKYIRMWRSLFANPEIPQKIKAALMERPLYTLRRLAYSAREGILTDDDWVAITKASDHHAIVQIVEARAGKPSRGFKPINIKLYPNGQLIAFRGNKTSTLGIIRNSPEDLKDKLRWEAIERIKNASGIKDG